MTKVGRAVRIALLILIGFLTFTLNPVASASTPPLEVGPSALVTIASGHANALGAKPAVLRVPARPVLKATPRSHGDSQQISDFGVAAEAGGAGGRIVLGHYPEYVQLGEKLGARTFSMPAGVFDAMSAEEQWAANQAFLDDAIAQGSEIHLATVANAAREGSFYERELQYMQARGYSVSSDGTMLVPGR